MGFRGSRAERSSEATLPAVFQEVGSREKGPGTELQFKRA